MRTPPNNAIATLIIILEKTYGCWIVMMTFRHFFVIAYDSRLNHPT